MNILRTLLTLIATTFSLLTTAANLCHLTMRSGLAGTMVSQLLPDHTTGMMWIATSNGINLYDGHTIYTYNMPRTADGLPNFCYDLSLDGQGNLYAATLGGVYRLERYGQQLRLLSADIQMAECVVCYNGNVYVGARTGFYCINKKGEVRPIDLKLGGLTTNNSVRCLRCAPDGTIWLTTRNALCQYSPKSGQMRRLPLPTPSGLSHFDLVGQKLFVGTKNNGLYVMDSRTGQYHRIGGMGNAIHDVKATADGLLTIATDGDGAYLMDAKSETLTKHFSTQADEDHRLASDAVYAYYRSPKGVDWIGTARNGIYYTYYIYRLFSTYQCGAFSSAGLSVGCFYADADVKLMATTNGFYLIDERKRTARFYDTRPYGIRLIKTISRKGSDFLIGSLDGGVLLLNTTTGQLGRVPGQPVLESTVVTDAATDRQGDLWLSSSDGLFHFCKDGSVRNYTDRNSNLPGGTSSIKFDSRGNGWVSTFEGISLYSPQDDKFKNDGFPQGFFNKLGRAKLVRGKGNKMLAYMQNRIFETTDDMSSFGEWQLPEGLLDERCNAVVDDHRGHYWIDTEKGIYRINYDMTQPVLFDAGVGLTSNMATNQRLFVGNDTLWANSNDGLKWLDLRQLDGMDTGADEHYRYRIGITTAVVNGRPVSSGQLLRIVDSQELHLKWNLLPERLVIHPHTTDYVEDDNVMFEYSLDGSEWRLADPGRPIVLSLDMPGRHRLVLRNSGIGVSETTYAIYVYPSLLFWFEVVLLLLSGAIFFWWNRWRKHTRLLIAEHVATEQALIDEGDRLLAAGDELKEEKDKYMKSRVGDEELARVAATMKAYIEDSKPYTDKDLKMSDIAAAISVSPSVLSQVFSLYLKEPYYDYINRYRLEVFKQLIAEGKHKQFTITALSEQCGFKKTSFFSTFRKVEGMTPTEYINKLS